MRRPTRLWRAAVAGLALATAIPSLAQTTVNLREADIRAFIDDVARVTGATFVIDPRVQGKVSVVSEKPLGRSQYFELFLATLRANGYVAVPAGTGQYRIQPAEAGAGAAGARFSTAVIPLTNIDAQQAVDSLRPVLSRNGAASANRAGNAVIVTDFADNISRARQVLRDVDRDRSTTQVVQLRNAGARDLATSLQQLVRQPGGTDGTGAMAVSVVPIDASNAIAIRGEQNQVTRVAKIARDLDQKAAGGSESRVIFLQHADASAVMPVLQQLMGQTPTPVQTSTGIQGLAGTPFGNRQQQAQQQQAAAPVAATPANVGAAAGNSRRRAIITRYEGANALIIAAPPEIQRELGEVIRQLDTRRAQVQVEAIIVEISDTAARQLGVQFMLAGKDGTVPLISSNFSNAAPNLLAVAGAVAAEKGVITGTAADQFKEAAVTSLLGTTGLTSGVASLAGNTIFGFVINAVKSDVNSNVLSTPSILTLDNQPARILVGQEIPVTTGEALGNNLDNSFRTVSRQDVGIQLAVKPQINAGGTVTLTINQIVSSIAATVADTDFILNKRELETAVTVGDGQILALGGLLDDNERKSLQKIPLLGDIPGLGVFFRSTGKSRVKTNLMIFIRPTIIRSQADGDAVTANRWDSIRESQEAMLGFSSLDAMAWDYLRVAPPYKPAPFPPPQVQPAAVQPGQAQPAPAQPQTKKR
ncbi:MAG: type II secretion system protein GspD [Sphingomonas sp.]|nr:MAG: type II secretion system protein GspD [Sphingomonas sp.]